MQNKIIIAAISAVVVGLGGAYLLYTPQKIEQTSVGDITKGSSTSSKKYITSNGITFETDVDSPGGITVETVPVLPTPMPSLTRAVRYDANLSVVARDTATSNIGTLRASLADDPRQPLQWLRLGIYYKMAGDYQATREVWDYVTRLAPKDVIAFNNLADLYQHFLKDQVKAELNWKKTIELDPTYIAGYRGLYDVYRTTGQTEKARAVLIQGVAKNPSSTELKSLLDSLK